MSMASSNSYHEDMLSYLLLIHPSIHPSIRAMLSAECTISLPRALIVTPMQTTPHAAFQLLATLEPPNLFASYEIILIN